MCGHNPVRNRGGDFSGNFQKTTREYKTALQSASSIQGKLSVYILHYNGQWYNSREAHFRVTGVVVIVSPLSISLVDHT